MQTRQDFTKNLINTLQTGADNLVLADTNEEGANMLALQTRQSLSTTALSLANQASQAVLRLFGWMSKRLQIDGGASAPPFFYASLTTPVTIRSRSIGGRHGPQGRAQAGRTHHPRRMRHHQSATSAPGC